MIAANVPFFEQSMTRYMDPLLADADYELVTQSEDGNAVKAQQIMSTMLADKFSFIAKADGVPPKPFEELATQAKDQGTLFQNHAVQAVGGAGQNIMFDHAAAGQNIGTAAVEWAQANGIEKPVIGVLGNLEDPEGVKRTDVAVETVKAAFPDAELAGEVNAVDQPEDGAKGSANLLAAHPDINMILTFNTVSGKGAVQAAAEAGKDDPTKFFIGMADTEPETQDLIAKGGSIVQANWGALFEISAVLLVRDALAYANGETIQPTRAVGGRLLRGKEDVDEYRAIADDPTADAALPAYNDESLVKYSDVELTTGQSINEVL
jgi:ABC-type sugar transport system substrate-binding protein